jgi:hypothetical protein
MIFFDRLNQFLSRYLYALIISIAVLLVFSSVVIDGYGFGAGFLFSIVCTLLLTISCLYIVVDSDADDLIVLIYAHNIFFIFSALILLLALYLKLYFSFFVALMLIVILLLNTLNRRRMAVCSQSKSVNNNGVDDRESYYQTMTFPLWSMLGFLMSYTSWLYYQYAWDVSLVLMNAKFCAFLLVAPTLIAVFFLLFLSKIRRSLWLKVWYDAAQFTHVSFSFLIILFIVFDLNIIAYKMH